MVGGHVTPVERLHINMQFFMHFSELGTPSIDLFYFQPLIPCILFSISRHHFSLSKLRLRELMLESLNSFYLNNLKILLDQRIFDCPIMSFVLLFLIPFRLNAPSFTLTRLLLLRSTIYEYERWKPPFS